MDRAHTHETRQHNISRQPGACFLIVSASVAGTFVVLSVSFLRAWQRRTFQSGETLVDARGDTDVQIVRCVFRFGTKDKQNHQDFEFEQFYQVKRMIEGIGNVPCSTCPQTLNG